MGTAHGFHAVPAHRWGHEASIRGTGIAGFEIVGTERQVGRKFGRLDAAMERLLEFRNLREDFAGAAISAAVVCRRDGHTPNDGGRT